MTTNLDQALELALAATVKNELQVMESFCHQNFPCDLATTVAMRMSRAIVSSVCRLETSGLKLEGRVLSAELSQYLTESAEQILSLSKRYEERLKQSPDNEQAWRVWTV